MKFLSIKTVAEKFGALLALLAKFEQGFFFFWNKNKNKNNIYIYVIYVDIQEPILPAQGHDPLSL